MASAAPGRIAALLLALTLLWRVIEVNAVLYDDAGRPQLPSFGAAGLAGAPPEREALVDMLRENPAQVEALLVAARGFERESHFDAAAHAYHAAYELAPLDRAVLHAGSVFFLSRGKVAEALTLMDRLVEHYPETRERAFPALDAILAAKAHDSAWERIVERDPEWLGAFVVSSCRRGVEPGLLLPLFMPRVAARNARPAETSCLVERLRGAGRWDEAYQVWLNTLPRERLAEVGFVFNGGFENAPSGLGFDWMPTRQAERDVGHSVEWARNVSAAGKRALKVSYNGKRQLGNPIAQYLALAPGRYELAGLARPDGMRVGRGVQWTLRCVSDGKPGAAIAQSERFTGSSEWRRFTFDATVPASCRGQLLQLEPVGLEEGAVYVTGAAWFDDLAARQLR
jgi:hypothetical protein